MGNQAGIIIRNVKNELFHSAKRLILNEVKGIECLLAIGRRNWLHTGSYQAAKNIAFMFGLLESCKLNDIDFGIYIEDVLTRIMYGEHVDDSFLPCGYVPRYKEGQDAA